jgi:predicted SnoaL-like aldol condensation-catalyzing enzyme
VSGSVRSLLARYYQDGWQAGDSSAIADLLAEDYRDHDPLPGFGADKAAAAQMVEHVRATMPGRHLVVHHTIAEGGLAAAHWTMSWGAGEVLRGHDFFRLLNDQISEMWHCERRV